MQWTQSLDNQLLLNHQESSSCSNLKLKMETTYANSKSSNETRIEILIQNIVTED